MQEFPAVDNVPDVDSVASTLHYPAAPSVTPWTTRENTRRVNIGSVPLGGDAPISVQSMTTTTTSDIDATVVQIHELVEAGCEIIRVAVPHKADAQALGEIKNQITIPLVADIHFGDGHALTAIEQGVDKVRLNPGNIGGEDRIAKVVSACKERQVPIRIGVNAGSLEKRLIEKYGYPTPEAMVESALGHVQILEEHDFTDIVISLKASSAPMAIAAYRMVAEKVDYPLHLGITEAGGLEKGSLRSAVGIGALLAMGLGDTIRVSLTADSRHEVRTGFEILKNLGLRSKGPMTVSCPSCGRVEIDLVNIATEVERRLDDGYDEKITVAVMGCVVNGPGESMEADFGISGGKGKGLIYRQGELLRTVDESKLVESLFTEIDRAKDAGELAK